MLRVSVRPNRPPSSQKDYIVNFYLLRSSYHNACTTWCRPLPSYYWLTYSLRPSFATFSRFSEMHSHPKKIRKWCTISYGMESGVGRFLILEYLWPPPLAKSVQGATLPGKILIRGQFSSFLRPNCAKSR